MGLLVRIVESPLTLTLKYPRSCHAALILSSSSALTSPWYLRSFNEAAISSRSEIGRFRSPVKLISATEICGESAVTASSS